MQISITMRATTMGSENGYVVTEFMEGQTYDVGEALARTFLADGLAEEAGDEPGAEGLTALNLKQLFDMAAAEGVDLGGAKRKAEVIAAIEAARAVAAAAKTETPETETENKEA